MRVLVLGGGVIGVSCAWYLAQAGHEVCVIERESGPALATSQANAGQISPGYASPWAAPGIPLKALKWLFQRHAPLSIRPTLDPHQYLWLARMLRNCNAARYAINKERMMRLAKYSRDCLNQLHADTGIEYEGRRLGTVQLFRTQAQLDAAARDIVVLERHGVAHEVLDRAGIARVEPALAHATVPLVGALRLPGDQTGDCRLFTERLAARAAEAGVEFRYHSPIEALDSDGQRITGVRIGGRRERADRYVVALGSWSPALLRPLGIHLPIYPLKGYSLTLPIRNDEMAPVSTVLDETYKIAITRFDHRIRVGGMAEVAGFDLRLNPRRRHTLEQVVRSLYPHGGALEDAQFWTGLRPATPDGPPIVGASRYDNLFLNAGHGTLGWTMACGSGRYLADLISGQTPAIRREGLGIERYG